MKHTITLLMSVIFIVFLGLSGCSSNPNETPKGKPMSVPSLVPTFSPSPTHIPTRTKISSPTKTPTASLYPDFSPTQAYSRYTPNHGSFFKIAYDYPSNWDQNYQALPEYDSEEWNFWIAAAGDVTESIALSVYEYNSDKDVIKRYINTIIQNGEILDDRVINIDGYSARCIVSSEPPEYRLEGLDADNHYGIRIFMKIDKQLYDFLVFVPESEKQRDFVQVFWHMVESMKYMP